MTTNAKSRLLVLDDDPDVGITICVMARSVGFEARTATHAREFFEILADWQPDYLALDLIMPDIDGIEVMRRLAELQCTAAVIITSGAGQRVVEAAQRASVERGLNVLGVMPKPFSPAEFRAMLQQPVRKGAEMVPHRTPPEPTRLTRADLYTALESHQFRVFFQPKISCADGRIAGFEALIRWQNPEHGLIGPDAFIPFAESTDLIKPMTFQVMSQAFAWLGTHFPDEDRSMSVNLSPRMLGDLQMANQIFASAWNRDVDPARVILEVTESSAMNDPLTTLDLLTRLRIKGFHLSIDDFGVGYSSMVQLARLPYSEIKIDRSFVKNLATSEDSQKIVRGIIGLGHSLDMRVTAEGVEDFEAFVRLKALHCDCAQGYLIGRPMDEKTAWEWVRHYQGVGNPVSLVSETAC